MRRWWLIPVAIALAAACGWATVRWGDGVIDALGNAQRQVVAWIARHPVLGAAAFLAASTLGKITPLPSGAVLLLSGGYLFGPVLGPVLSALGAALCAVLVAVAGTRLLVPLLEARFGHRLERLERAIGDDSFHWLLAARLVPVFPAWLVNLAPLVVPMPLRTVFGATLLGLLPVAFVIGGIGNGLSTLAAAERVDATVVFSPTVLLPLVGLALLALVPVALRRWRRA